MLIGQQQTPDFQTWCPFYIEDEEWIDKKLYYRKIKYIISNSERILRYTYNK